MTFALFLQLMVGLTVSFGNFDFCDGFIEGQHKMEVVNGVVTENYIKICTNAKDLPFITNHELAHQFWWVKMTDKQREEYRLLQTDNIDDYFRKYSMKNEAEDFADNFANIVLGRRYNKSEAYDNKIDFINELLK